MPRGRQATQLQATLAGPIASGAARRQGVRSPRAMTMVPTLLATTGMHAALRGSTLLSVGRLAA